MASKLAPSSAKAPAREQAPSVEAVAPPLARSAPGDALGRLDRGAISAPQVLQLQRLIGNRATHRFLMETPQTEPARAPTQAMQKKSEDEKHLQGVFVGTAPAQVGTESGRRPNNTGLPDQLKAGIESLSGISMDDVKVHYNSEKPAQLQALAYTQGSEIHVAPGQEQHLPHEAWHVVQQSDGRVPPTMQMKGVAINDDTGLEREADVLGAKALQLGAANATRGADDGTAEAPTVACAPLRAQRKVNGQVVQRVIPVVAQPTSNTCWAAAGYAVHRHAGGAVATLQAFVTAQGSANARTRFANNQVCDIDEIIGGQSTTNRLTGSDSAGSYGKAGITSKLNAGNPIVANVNNNHYIILTARTIVGGVYRLTYMDPAAGSVTANAVEDASSSLKITGVGAYTLSVLYYTG